MNLTEFNTLHRKEPAHLRTIPEHICLRLALEHKEAARNNWIDDWLNRVWALYKAGERDTGFVRWVVVRALYYWTFGRLDTPNLLRPSHKLMQHDHEIQAKKLERLHDLLFELLGYASDQRTKTIFDFDGVDDKGKPQTFAQYLHRVTSNKHRRLRKTSLVTEKERRWLETQINYADTDTETVPRDGSVCADGNPHSYAEPAMSTANVLPAPDSADVDTVAVVPVDLRIQLDLVADKFAAEYPHIAEHLMAGVRSASAIERHLKNADNKRKPAGRKTIAQVLDDFDAEMHDVARHFVQRQPWFTSEDGEAVHSLEALRGQQQRRLKLYREAAMLLETWKATKGMVSA